MFLILIVSLISLESRFFLSCLGNNSPSLSPLYIAGFVPITMNHSKWNVGVGVLPAVQQAIRDINLNKSVLPDYELTVQFVDTKVC